MINVEELFGVSEVTTKPEPQKISKNTEDISNVEPTTNLDLLSRMLHKNLREYVLTTESLLRGKFSRELVETFKDIIKKIGDEDVTPEVLDALLPDLGIKDVTKDIIVKNFRLVGEDSTQVLCKSTYERFREIVYRAYLDTINSGSAVGIVDSIQDAPFFLPPYGSFDSSSFMQVKFGSMDINSIVESLGNPIYSHFEEINNSFPIHGYIPNQTVMVAGPPGGGKTFFMMTEAANIALQGHKVTYVAIGDLKPFDFANRITAMIGKTNMNKNAMNLKQNYETVCRLYPALKENLNIQFISPDKYTAGQWLKMNERMGILKDYNVFFLDYDTNFASTKESMYSKGDEVYTTAYKLSCMKDKLVFIGSQPKIGAWKDSELGLESAAESSRKQQIVDVMITLSHDKQVKNPKNHIGIINMPKNRRGSMSKFKYILDPTGVMEPIDDTTYFIFKDESSAVSVVNTDGYDPDVKYVDLSQVKTQPSKSEGKVEPKVDSGYDSGFLG